MSLIAQQVAAAKRRSASNMSTEHAPLSDDVVREIQARATHRADAYISVDQVVIEITKRLCRDLLAARETIAQQAEDSARMEYLIARGYHVHAAPSVGGWRVYDARGNAVSQGETPREAIDAARGAE